ncbi:MAG TPA: anhydro-N-acetylmuramic acid kinase [Chitinophagaceae bacterium]|nr:anhydro-N-acetylmuramic acid kinase [Chitinophagaceae bacterium]
MVYKVIGAMSGSSLDGLDLVFAAIQEKGGAWSYEIIEADCYPYPPQWTERLRQSTSMDTASYLVLDQEYGRYTGGRILEFIHDHGLDYQVHFICSHGHTSFHEPGRGMTAQLGSGASIAAITGLPVVSDLRAMDVALGGQGAPLVPIGEMHLFADFDLLLNLGGISNISCKGPDGYHGFDICPANSLLNAIAMTLGVPYDDGGKLAEAGTLNSTLLDQLNTLPFYRRPPPKSLDNGFGTEVLLPMVLGKAPGEAGLRTVCEHIAIQVSGALGLLDWKGSGKMLVTGGGVFNRFLMKRIVQAVSSRGVTVVIPDDRLVKFKEALIMAFIGVLRWRQMDTTLASVTGASRNSIGGAIWSGMDD